jgi:DNA-directed RNA polymerase subunit beta
MQRQALPLIKPYAPIVGTGIEYKVAHDSGAAFVSDVNGTVEYVDGNQIIIKDAESKKHTFELSKYMRSNQETCINHTPIVNVGDKIKVDDILADGPAMNNGELSLGRNVLVAFTT